MSAYWISFTYVMAMIIALTVLTLAYLVRGNNRYLEWMFLMSPLLMFSFPLAVLGGFSPVPIGQRCYVNETVIDVNTTTVVRDCYQIMGVDPYGVGLVTLILSIILFAVGGLIFGLYAAYHFVRRGLRGILR